MNELKSKIHDETSGLDYVLAGDYYIPAIELLEGDDRPVGKWGQMHRAYLEETNPLLLNHLILRVSCTPALLIWTNRRKNAIGSSSAGWRRMKA